MSSHETVDAKSVEVVFQPSGKVVITAIAADGSRRSFALDDAVAEELSTSLGRGLSAMRQNPAAP